MVVRMRIVRDQRRLCLVEGLETLDHPRKGRDRLDRLQIADVLAEEDLLPLHQPDRILEVSASRQNYREPATETDRDREGREATRPSQNHLPSSHDANDRIVCLAKYRPIVIQNQIRDPGQPVERFHDVNADRLVGEVAARRDKRPPNPAHDQMVERRRWQHHAQSGVARRDRSRNRPPAPHTPVEQHDRRLRTQQQPLLGRRHQAVTLNFGQTGIEQRQRLLGALLAATQLPQRPLIPGVNHEVEAAKPLHRDDSPLAERRAGHRQRLFPLTQPLPRRIAQRESRPTLPTAVRLSVKTPVCRVLILCTARRAHHEPLHCRRRPVIRQRLDDRVSGSTIGTVGEWIAESPIGWIEDLRQALPTRRDVRQHQRSRLPGFRRGYNTGQNPEMTVTAGIAEKWFEAGDHRQRRRLARHFHQELAQWLLPTLDLELNPGHHIPNPAGQPH